MKAVRAAVLSAALLASLVVAALTTPARIVDNGVMAAGFGGPSWSGSSPPFQGGTITQGITFSGSNPDISTPGAEDLNLLPGSGIVEIKKAGGSSILKFIDGSGNSANITWTPNGFSVNNVAGAGSVYLNTGVSIGRTGNQTATTVVGGVHDSLTTISSGTGLFDVYGEGLQTAGSGGVQTPTACAGTMNIDPQSSVIIVDGGALACTATITTTSMSTIAQEGLPIRISAKNVGAATIKFASTNFATALPARCTGTGLALGQSMLIAWDKDQTKWTFLGGCE